MAYPWIMDGHGQGICLGWSISILEPRTAEGGDAWLGFSGTMKPRVIRLISPQKGTIYIPGKIFLVQKLHVYIYI